MFRLFSFIVLFSLCWVGAARAEEACVYQSHLGSDPAQATIKRGINMSRWWEDDRHQTPDQEDLKNLSTLGFDFVRLPISPKWLTLDDESDQKEKLEQLRCDVISLLNQNLSVIIDLHAMGAFHRSLTRDPNEGLTRLEMIWRRLAPVLAGLPPQHILIGFLNEPKFETAAWWQLQGQLVKDLRDVYPDNPFVVTAAPDGGPWDLIRMEPYDDDNVIYDFHFYQPMFFTHHGGNWFPGDLPLRKTMPIIYPVGDSKESGQSDDDVKAYMEYKWDRKKLAGFIDKIASWAKSNKVQAACLEFGVYRPFNDKDSRAHWISDMRELLEANNLPWALWEYRGGFGLIDGSGEPEEGIVKALGLNHSRVP